MNNTDKLIDKALTVIGIIAVVVVIIYAITTGEPVITECHVNTPC